MIDAVDSQTDPAGKQYRASVSKAVNVGEWSTDCAGYAGDCRARARSKGWTTQLTSLTVGGQAVAVTSSSASVTSAAQSAASTAANAVGSVFGGFGHHAPPAAVTAVATGQRVVSAAGSNVNFHRRHSWRAGGAAPTADATPAASPAAPETPAVAAARPPIPAPAASVGCRSSVCTSARGIPATGSDPALSGLPRVSRRSSIAGSVWILRTAHVLQFLHRDRLPPPSRQFSVQSGVSQCRGPA